MVWTLTTYHLSLTVLMWALAAVALPTVQGKVNICFQLIASLPNIDPHVLGWSLSDLDDCVSLAFTHSSDVPPVPVLSQTLSPARAVHWGSHPGSQEIPLLTSCVMLGVSGGAGSLCYSASAPECGFVVSLETECHGLFGIAHCYPVTSCCSHPSQVKVRTSTARCS